MLLTVLQKSFSFSLGTKVPVGLFGLHRKTNLVFFTRVKKHVQIGRERERARERDREAEIQRGRETDRQTERQTGSAAHRYRETERQR